MSTGRWWKSAPAVAVVVGGLASSSAIGEDRAVDLAERQARSVHLWFPAPEATAFYHEVTVEESVPGSYFMACGFRHGYFGIQQMSRPDQPRRVLFSVWDASRGDDPNAVKADRRVRELGHGENVTIRRFGGEGTGGQSFFFYDWKPGETCWFLITAEGNGDRTAYAAYFYLNTEKRWAHVATFDTLAGGDRLAGLYSFVEDFRRDGASARQARRARFGNGWVRLADGSWKPLLEARFTADRTPSETIDAGVVEGGFFLATGGSVQNHLALNSSLSRAGTTSAPMDLPVAATEQIETP